MSFFPLNSLKFRKLQSLTDPTSHSAKQIFIFRQFASIVLFTEQLKYWHRKLKFPCFFFLSYSLYDLSPPAFIIFQRKRFGIFHSTSCFNFYYIYCIHKQSIFKIIWLTSYCINQQFVLLPSVTFLKYIHVDSYRLPLFEMPTISYVKFLYLFRSYFLLRSYFLYFT